MVKFGVHLPQVGVDYSQIREIARTCEHLGSDSVWVTDHLLPIVGSPTASYLEGWTLLSALAEATSKVRIGTMVLCNMYRHPQILAKMASTLDVISNGRLELGMGAGWYKPEADAYGMPFPKASVRIGMLQEALEVIKKMWSEDRASFQGKYYSISEATCLPKPIQKPHPPINMPGRYPATVRTAAKHADIFTPLEMAGPRANLKPIVMRNKQLEFECEKVGRNYDEIEKAVIFRLMLAENESGLDREMMKWLPPTVSRRQYEQAILCCTPQECASIMGEYVDAGITYFYLDLMDVSAFNGMRLFAETVMKEM